MMKLDCCCRCQWINSDTVWSLNICPRTFWERKHTRGDPLLLRNIRTNRRSQSKKNNLVIYKQRKWKLSWSTLIIKEHFHWDQAWNLLLEDGDSPNTAPPPCVRSTYVVALTLDYSPKIDVKITAGEYMKYCVCTWLDLDGVFVP